MSDSLEPTTEPSEASCTEDKPRGEVLGIDQMAVFNEYLGSLKQHLEANRAKTRAAEAEAAARAVYEPVDEIWMRCHRRVDRMTGRTVYRGYPVDGTVLTWELHMPDLGDLLHESRFSFATALFDSKVCPDWDQAKRRAAKSVIKLAELIDDDL